MSLLWYFGSASGAPEPPADALAGQIAPGLRIGPRDTRFPVQPLYAPDAPVGTEPAGYLFRSSELLRIPGYAGSAPELLIALDTGGRLLGVRMLAHNEPVFVDGLGPAPLQRFLQQYAGRSLYEQPKLDAAGARPGAPPPIDGVSGATVSVRVIHETVLASALRVARARLPHLGALAGGGVRAERFEPAGWREMVGQGWVRALAVSRRDLALAFLGTGAQRWGWELFVSGESFIELQFALLDPPSVGRNLLGAQAHRRLLAALGPGAHAVGVLVSGGHSFPGENIEPQSLEQALSVRQHSARIALEEMAWHSTLQGRDVPEHEVFKVFRIHELSGFDPAAPWSLELRIARAGDQRPGTTARYFREHYRLPARFFATPGAAEPGAWRGVWRERAPEIAVLGGALALLGLALARQRWLTADARRFAWLRWAFLAFTAVWLGWYVQGQLSVVNLVAAARAALGGFDLSAYLYAPLTVLLAAFALASAVVWGRGTYCGWLCPFGALQEFVAAAARRLRIRQWRVPEPVDRVLARAKYMVLAAILLAALVSAGAAERMSEVEPFRTAVNLRFQRDWPYVAWAAAMLGLSAVVFKGFCRWLCPLGAALAVLGRARRLDWVPRRAPCGAPCQLCRHRCAYKAIERSGAIRYDECFQCMECVVIHDDRRKCAPLILADKRARRAAAITSETLR